MMRKIVVDPHAIDFSANLQPPLHAFERRKRLLNHSILDAQLLRRDDDAQRILHIEDAGHRNREVSRPALPTRTNIETPFLRLSS